MSQFNAGSIMATLDVDRDPFTMGLDEAKRQEEAFAAGRPTVTLGVDDTAAEAQLDDFETKLDGVGADKATPSVGVDDDRAKLELDELALKLEDLKHTRVVIDVQRGDISSLISDTNALLAQVDQIAPAAERAIGDGGNGAGGAASSAASSGPEGLTGMAGLIALAAMLSPALIPIGATALSVFGALATGATEAGVSLGSFAIVAKSDFTDMQTKIKAVTAAQAEVASASTIAEKVAALKTLHDAEAQLKGPIGEAAAAYEHLMGVWDKVKADTAGPVFTVITDALGVAAKVLPELEPLIDATARALGNSVNSLGDFLGSKDVTGFLSMIENSVGPDIGMVTHTIIDFVDGLIKLAPGFNGALTNLLGDILGLAKSFDKWAGSKAGRTDMTQFFDYAKNNGPAVAGFFGAIVKDFAKLVISLSAPGSKMLPDITKFLNELPGLLPGMLQLSENFLVLMDGLAKISPILGPLGKLIALAGKLSGLPEIKAIIDVPKVKTGIADVNIAANGLWVNLKALGGFVSSTASNMASAMGRAGITIVERLSAVKSYIGGAFTSAVHGLEHVWDAVWGGLKSAVSSMWGGVEPIFAAIWGWLQKITGPLSRAISLGESFIHKAGSIFGHAVGGETGYGDVSLVGENGPELVTLPGGTHVYGAQTTAQMLSGAGTSTVQQLLNAINAQTEAIKKLATDTGTAVGDVVNAGLAQNARLTVQLARAG